MAWLRSAASTPVSQFHPHLKALEEANPGLFDKSAARPIGDDPAVEDVEAEVLGHVGSDVEDQGSPSYGREKGEGRQPLDEITEVDVVEITEIDVVESIEADTQGRDKPATRPRDSFAGIMSIFSAAPFDDDTIILRTSPFFCLNTLYAFATSVALPFDISHLLEDLVATFPPYTGRLSFSQHQQSLHAQLLDLIKVRLLSNLGLMPASEAMTQKELKMICIGQGDKPELADEILLRFLTYLEDNVAFRLLSEAEPAGLEYGLDPATTDEIVGGGKSAVPETEMDVESSIVDTPEDADHTRQADFDRPSADQEATSDSGIDLNRTDASGLSSTDTRQQLPAQGLPIPTQMSTTPRLRKLVIWSWLWL